MQRLPEVADDGAAAAASPAVAGDDGSEQCAGRCRPLHGQHRLESVAEWGAHRPGTGGESHAAGRPRGGERAVDVRDGAAHFVEQAAGAQKTAPLLHLRRAQHGHDRLQISGGGFHGSTIPSSCTSSSSSSSSLHRTT